MSPDILILCATRHEIAPFLCVHPAAEESVSRTGFCIMAGSIKGRSYQLAITGPGVFNTAHALTVLLEQQSPGLVLQTGIAGVFRQTGLVNGDVAVASEQRYIHTGLAEGLVEKKSLPFELIQDLPSTRLGAYPFDNSFVESCCQGLQDVYKNTDTQTVTGAFITVSGITANLTLADKIYTAYTPVMEAMEGAASAHISALYRIPFLEVRSASNQVGIRDKSKWDIKTAAGRIVDICRVVSGLH